jgi:hypothetical protein
MNELAILEHQDARVLTTRALAENYGTEPQIITNNFGRNRERYIEGKHYYQLEGDDLKAFRTANQFDVSLKLNKLYLWTERGALLHAKSLNTDKAWEVYDRLVETYFRARESAPQMSDKDKRLKIMTYNARTSRAKLLYQMTSVSTLPSEYKNMLVAAASEILLGRPLFPPDASKQRTYSAAEIGAKIGLTAVKVGKLTNELGLKTADYGEWRRDKAKYSPKEVDSFRYYDNIIPKLKEALELSSSKGDQKHVNDQSGARLC